MDALELNYFLALNLHLQVLPSILAMRACKVSCVNSQTLLIGLDKIVKNTHEVIREYAIAEIPVHF